MLTNFLKPCEIDVLKEKILNIKEWSMLESKELTKE